MSSTRIGGSFALKPNGSSPQRQSDQCQPGAVGSVTGGQVARMASSSRLSQGWSTAFVADATGSAPGHRPGGRPEQGEQLGGAAMEVLMRQPDGVAFWLPGGAVVGDGLIRSGLILAPDLQPQRLPQAIGTLDQVFFGGGLRVGDRHHRPVFVLAGGGAGVASGPVLLEGGQRPGRNAVLLTVGRTAELAQDALLLGRPVPGWSSLAAVDA